MYYFDKSKNSGMKGNGSLYVKIPKGGRIEKGCQGK
jgi:hypothetical protein